MSVSRGFLEKFLKFKDHLGEHVKAILSGGVRIEARFPQ